MVNFMPENRRWKDRFMYGYVNKMFGAFSSEEAEIILEVLFETPSKMVVGMA